MSGVLAATGAWAQDQPDPGRSWFPFAFDNPTFTARFDNSGNEDSGRLRLFGIASAGQILRADDGAYVGYLTSPEAFTDNQTVFGGYQLPIFGPNTVLSLSGNFSSLNFTSRGTDGGDPLAGFQSGYRAEIEVRHYFDRRYVEAPSGFVLGTVHSLYSRLALQHTETAFELSGEEVDSDLDTLPLLFGYDFRSTFTPAISASGSLEYLRNVSVGPFGDDSDFDDNRLDSDPSTDLFRSTLQLGYVTPGGWAARLLGYFQYAGEPLVSPFLFSLGGPLSVRALQTGEAFGDNGIDSRLEFFTPFFLPDSMLNSAFGIFTDFGATSRETVEDENAPDSDTALGVGAAWSWRGIQGIEVDVDASYLVAGSIIDNEDINDDERWQVYFVLALTF